MPTAAAACVRLGGPEVGLRAVRSDGACAERGCEGAFGDPTVLARRHSTRMILSRRAIPGRPFLDDLAAATFTCLRTGKGGKSGTKLHVAREMSRPAA